MIDKQAIYDKIVNGLRAQEYKIALEGGCCAYLTNDGLRCGIGQLMQEGEKLTEGLGIHKLWRGQLASRFFARLGCRSIEDAYFLENCQYDLHDVLSRNYPSPLYNDKPWEERKAAMEGLFEDFAESCGLIYTPPSA